MPRPETENENISTNWKQPWSGKLPCWGTAWHLSDQEKVTSTQAPPASPQGEDCYSQWSDLLELADKTMAKQILWTRKIWHMASHPRLVWLAEEVCPHVLVLRGLGVKAEDFFCWRVLFGHLTTLPHASVSLLFFSFDTLPFGVCFNIICSSRNLLHVFYAVPHMVRSWGNCSW